MFEGKRCTRRRAQSPPHSRLDKLNVEYRPSAPELKVEPCRERSEQAGVSLRY